MPSGRPDPARNETGTEWCLFPPSGTNRKSVAFRRPRAPLVYVKEIHRGEKVPADEIGFEQLTAETYQWFAI
jgi:hypothetical protein